MTRRAYVLGVVMVAALAGSGAPHAQTPATNQRVWTGTWEEHDSWEGHSKFGRKQAQISFVYVEGRDEFGSPRWESRRLTWSAQWEERQFDYVALLDTDPGERGFTQRRYRQDSVRLCKGGGTLDLGPEVHGGEDILTPEQKARLQADCVTTYQPRDDTPAPPPTLSREELLQLPKMPNEDQLVGCAYETSWPKGGRPAGSFSVSVSAPVTAVMEADPKGEYGRFVPVPGQTLTFVAKVLSGEARFRFELDPEATSHFPGYATNANIDDEFFVKYNLGMWRGRYANDGPDAVFDDKHFGTQEWSRIEPLVVETRAPQNAVVVTVTTMDYGAVSKLRGFVKSDECGDWQPIPVRVGAETREAIAIPMDEDNNLMADALENYRGLESGADDDAEPKGNGMAGDGLTAFEEYRGFLTRGDTCREAWTDAHVRAAPDKKTLFVMSEDPYVDPVIEAFGETLGLELHVVCGRHIVGGDAILAASLAVPNLEPGGEWAGGPNARIINWTLPDAGLRSWRGRRLTHDEPQRALVVRRFSRMYMNDTKDYPSGVAIPIDKDAMGPPGLTTLVLIASDQLLTDPEQGELYELIDERGLIKQGQSTERLDRLNELVDERLWHRIVHELGHAVGMPHHGDTVVDFRERFGPMNVTAALSPRQRSGGSPDFSLPEASLDTLDGLLIDPGPACQPEGLDAYFDNSRTHIGCLTTRIVRRGQQNSGNFMCPMRYQFGEYSFYEPPGTSIVFRGFREVVGPQNFSERQKVDVWSGRVLVYQWERERTPLGTYCTSTAGTELNAGADDSNHSGNAGREKACTEFLVIRDGVAARGRLS